MARRSGHAKVGRPPPSRPSGAEQTWQEADRYLETVLPRDTALAAALRDSERAGLPDIQVSPLQGQFLYLIARVHRAQHILEIGTLGGYSTICLARALEPSGQLVTLEVNPLHARVATKNLKRAGLQREVEVRVGPALESLEALSEEKVPPFDLTFIDADKENNPQYLEWAIRLSRPGALIIVDNVVRGGRVRDPKDKDPRVRATRAMFRAISGDPRLKGTVLQTVGSKGHDGFFIGEVLARKGRTAARP